MEKGVITSIIPALYALWRLAAITLCLTGVVGKPLAVADALISAAFFSWLFLSAAKRRKANSARERARDEARAADAQNAFQQNLLLNQINPHFLYNTLESIRGKAMLDGNGQVADMIEALSAFFRYGVSYRSGIVTLADELHNVDEYVKIQSFRFNDRFRVVKQIDPTLALNACFLPKLTLQPIVENAIVHGIEDREYGGTVTIRVENLDTHIHISVADDGVGMSEEKLCALNDSLGAVSPKTAAEERDGPHSGIALSNIQKRIKLYFGDAYSMAVYSTKNAGTTVELVIPKQESPVFSGEERVT